MIRRFLLAFILLVVSTPAYALTYVASEYLALAAVTSDTLVMTGPGLLHTVTCSSDAAATAGSLAIRDGVAAGGGTVLQTITFVAAYFAPVTLTFDYTFTAGLYLDFTTTADVSCSVSYRKL